MMPRATDPLRVLRPPGGLLIVALLLLGLGVRLSGIAAPEARILQQFPTEDGYLMLQVARNLAVGHGLSTAAGEIPTNGVQPGGTLLWAGLYAVVGGDKTAGVVLVLLVQLALAGIAAWLLRRLALRVLAPRSDADRLGTLAAAAWFASPIALPHTMNCLESGLYVVLGLGAANLFFPPGRAEAPWPWRRCVALGAVLGAVFWARNDGIFLVAAATLVHLTRATGPAGLGRRLRESTVMGATSVVVAVPWLVHNQTRFGSIVPVSGQAESLHTGLGASLYRLPPVLLEYLGVLFPIPSGIELESAFIFAAAAMLGVALGLAPRLWRRLEPRERRLAGLVGVYAAGLCAFYGLAFGAAHFMSRYLLPLSPYLALLASAGGLAAWRRVAPAAPRLAVAAAALLWLLPAAAHWRYYRRALPHAHFQVVRWVESHVPSSAAVGAVQSGTLGYFHDRTVNLDGKVNPEALRAREAHRIPFYIVESDIQYLADWAFMAEWHDLLPVIGEHFEVLVDDPARNLGVLGRVGAPRLDSGP